MTVADTVAVFLTGRARSRSTPARIGRPVDRALTASASRAEDSAGALRRLDQNWQRKAMFYYRSVGECWNPAQYYSRSLERIRFYPARRTTTGQPEEITSGPELELFNRIRSPGGSPGDLSALAGDYGRLQWLIGDGLLTVSQDDDQEEAWEYLSPMELRLQPDANDARPQEYRRHRAPGATPEELTEAPDSDFQPMGGQARVWRLHRRHPEYSQWADSPIRPILDLYELLSRLTMAANAEASSRAAQRGLLFLPSELSFGPVDKTQEENPELDPLIREFQLSMQRAIRNPGSAEAMSPFIMRAAGVTTTSAGAVPTADLIKWIALGPTDRYAEAEMWEATIARIAASLDLPKEMLTGIEDVSHWSAWFLDEVGFRQHTGPAVIRFCNDLAGAYLRPAARDARIAGADQLTIWFDASQAINHPDEIGTVEKAHDRLVVSDDYYREKIGAPKTAKPDEDELARRVLIKLREIPEEFEDAVGASQNGAGETPPPQGGRGGDANEGPPEDSEERPPGNQPPAPGAAMQAQIIGAATIMVDRARELAGNRLVRRAQDCEPCKETIRDVPKGLVASSLGMAVVREIIDGHVTETALVAGVGSQLAERLKAWGIAEGWPERLGAMVEQHAVRTLYEPEAPPLPSGFAAAAARAVA